jgi:hypothetical protein
MSAMNDDPKSAGAKTLLVLGASGRKHLMKAVSDWSRTVVLEVDGYLPESLRHRCAAVMTIPPLLPEQEAAEMQARTDHVLDQFLEDHASVPGLETGRSFRASCMSIEAWRIVGPHVVCLEYARRLAGQGPWERIVVAPGAGVSLRAFRQLGESLGVPVEVLSIDREKPPLFWLLKRKWQRSRSQQRTQQTTAPTLRLNASTQPGECWCSDPRLEGIVARSDQAERWVNGPRFADIDKNELEQQRAAYGEWWEAWWKVWKDAHQQDDPMSDHWILEDLGRWFSRERFPRHALLLRQAREAMKAGRPTRVLLGSMRGRQEFLWGVAAQELSIPVAVYTIDCHIEPRLCFKPDFVLCDDMRQWEVAQEKGIETSQLVRVRSHRQPRARDEKPMPSRKRRQLLLADTYYSGIVAGSSPLLSLWAYQRVIEAARELPEHDFVIKYHPLRERPEATFQLSGQHHMNLWLKDEFIKSLNPPANVVFLTPEERLSDHLPNVDLLLNIQSYAGLEAFAQRIPVIYLQPWDEEGLYPRMNAMGVMQVAVTTNRLVELIRTNFDNLDHARQKLAAQAGYLDWFYWQSGPDLAQAALSATRE